MKKLSEFVGQEHVTSVLRASVMKNQPISNLAISGDYEIAYGIGHAYKYSLLCENQQRGDACGECNGCQWSDTRVAPFSFSNLYQPDAVNFQIKSAIGTYIDTDVLSLLVYCYQATKTDVISFTKKIMRQVTFAQFSENVLNILTQILALKHNVEVKEVDKLEALRVLSNRMSAFDVAAAIRLVWDSQSQSTLTDTLRIEIVSLLLSELFQPTPTPDLNKIWSQTDEKPIQVIEEDNLEQPLSLEEMLAVARS